MVHMRKKEKFAEHRIINAIRSHADDANVDYDLITRKDVVSCYAICLWSVSKYCNKTHTFDQRARFQSVIQ